jgi:hypothetical protein
MIENPIKLTVRNRNAVINRSSSVASANRKNCRTWLTNAPCGGTTYFKNFLVSFNVGQ